MAALFSVDNIRLFAFKNILYFKIDESCDKKLILN